MHVAFPLEIRQKIKVYVQWKQGQVSWEEYKDVVCHHREKIGKIY